MTGRHELRGMRECGETDVLCCRVLSVCISSEALVSWGGIYPERHVIYRSVRESVVANWYIIYRMGQMQSIYRYIMGDWGVAWPADLPAC